MNKNGNNLRIDAHQHFWDRTDSRFEYSWQEAPEKSNICRNFLPEDLLPLLQANNINHSIFVQTQHNLNENRWALELAKQNPFICGVVGWVDLTSDSCEGDLEEFTSQPRFVGIRHVVQDEPDPDFIVRDDVSRGLSVLEQHNVPFDLLFYSHHLKHAATVAARFPRLKLVIDHLSKPKIELGEIKEWKRDLQAAASHENVYCKLSGLITEASWTDWTLGQIQPYVDHALEYFGPQRMIFGSDWPVCLLAVSFSQVVSLAEESVKGLSESERQQVFGATAITFYDLKFQ